MSEKNSKKYKNYILAAAIIAATAAGYIVFVNNYTANCVCLLPGSFVWESMLFFVLVALICIRVRLGRPVVRLKGKIANIVCFFIVVFFVTCMEEVIWNPLITGMGHKSFALNYILVALFTACLVVIIRKPLIAYFISAIFNFLYGLVNFFVMSFIGCPPLIGDVLSFDTAVNVMGTYEYYINDNVVTGAFIFIILMEALLYFSPSDIVIKGSIKKKIIYTVCAVLVSAGAFIGVLNVSFMDVFHVEYEQWEPENSFESNGAPVMMLVSIQNLKEKKPEGYDAKEVQALLDTFESNAADSSELPNVIVIMNETFSDLSVLGDFESDDYLEFFNSLDSYVMRGNAYVSVLGGSTCNSEFEFLTGSTMGFIPSGINPYRNYNLSNSGNIPTLFADTGFETTAFHPCERANWNRERMYKQLNFQTFYSIEDMDSYEKIRTYVSDYSDYDFLNSIYESRTEDDIFIFNVTVQNHGGYSSLGGLEPVSIEEQYWGCQDVITYLSLIKQSDNAFKQLLDYYSKQTEPVVICFFGDHQPDLDSDFTDSVMSGNEYSNEIERNEQRYIVPYIIWSNYELNDLHINKDMSLNYLGANLLDILEIRTEYSSYLLDLQEDIPVVNALGYQTSDGVWHSPDEEDDRLKEYEKVQYYELFENK